MSYSIDLRGRVVRFVEAGCKEVEASWVFGICIPTINSWLVKKALKGTVKDDPPKRGWKKLEPIAVEGYVKQNPDLLLSDYAKYFGVSIVAISKAFKRLKITRKKRRPSIKKEAKKDGVYFWSS